MAAETPESLIKYCSHEAAELILADNTLRWSSPELFGDPFELSSKTDIGFDRDSLLESTVKLTSSMLFSSDHPKGDSPLVNAIKRWREEERFATAEEAYDVLRELLCKMVDYRVEQLSDSLSKWQIFVRNIRICCFCTKPDNIAAWEKYGNWHQGVALRFKTDDDSSLATPQAITYQVEPAHITTVKEQLGCILHNKKDAITNRFKEQYLTKGPHHKLEREWRCIQSSKKPVTASDNTPDNWVDDISFEKHEISGIYFGLNTPEDVKKRITSIAKERYKKAKLYQAVQAKTGYSLEMERLKP